MGQNPQQAVQSPHSISLRNSENWGTAVALRRMILGLNFNYITSVKWSDLEDFNFPGQNFSIMGAISPNLFLQKHQGSDENGLQATL